MNSKKFTIIFLGIIASFFFCNLVFWHAFNKYLIFPKEVHGDLTRLGTCMPAEALTKQVHYEKKHITFNEYLAMEPKPPIDILTIGDCFSNGTAGTFYQDYIVDAYGKNVVHIIAEGNPVCLFMSLAAAGYLQDMQPKVVIIESVEREVNNRFGNYVIQSADPSSDFFKRQKDLSASSLLADKDGWAPSLMIKSNLNYIKNKILYINTDNRISDRVHIEELTQSFFTNDNQENKLLFIHEDLWYMQGTANYVTINDNFNRLADELSVSGIALVFMVCADKFDLYYPYCKNHNQYPENSFFEEFECFPKRYFFVNTKRILRQMLAEGEKDVYWLDSTNWSWKAQQRVVDKMMQEITRASW